MSKYKLLVLGLVIDGIGILTSAAFFGVGDFADVIWAPLSAWLMTRMYKGNAGKIAGIATFIEELLPVTDVIPSFTLMWLYTYVFAKKEVATKEDESDIIDIT